ncbi:MAG TPA: DNA-processing protein DprA [Gemmatimonadaceae bacterium]|nr:DNA-processing protein DprA [Gemmatimonadaceae bacterium]
MSAPAPHSSSPEAAIIDTCVQKTDALYPAALKDLQENAPTRLFLRGRAATLDVQPRIAIVGTRRATSYGLRVARELATAFARSGACVVSGLARGIDGAAHQATLDADGFTIAVLGTGLDHSFPRAHAAMQSAIGQRGLLITELEPQFHGEKFTFPNRNRLIAALTSLTIVVEAPFKSGAIITADHALELGRTLAAIPGPIDQPQSAGTNRLIADGAHVITSPEDALALVGLTHARASRATPDGDDGLVWRVLDQGPLDLDALCHASGLPATQCLAAVTRLEISGIIECALTGEIRRR